MNPKFSILVFLYLILTGNSFSQSTERIFYSSFTPQDWDIYISKNAGQSFEKFTSHPSLDYDAVISPDGIWVVFTSERSGIPQLYIKAVDGNDTPGLLITSNSFQDQATFSPDGSQIAFVASHEDNSEIYLMDFKPDTIQDISVAENLTNHTGGDFRPAFSPDGKQIAFSSDRGHTIVPHPQFSFARQRIGDIYILNIPDKKVKRLTDVNSWDGSPVWSPDGSKIYFYSGRNGENSIFQMNADGTGEEQLIDYSGEAVSPVLLSEDKLAFTTWNSQNDFKIMQADLSANNVNHLYGNSPDLMFNLNVHPTGIMVFHGGKYAPRPEGPGTFGFDGDILAKIPDTLILGDKRLNIFGVRRAFVAAPHVSSTMLYYDANDFQNITTIIKPMGFGILIFPLLIIVLFIIGIVFSIKYRKKIPVWKNLLFSIITILAGIIVGGILVFILFFNPLPVNTIQIVMGSLFLILILLAWVFYKRKKQLRNNERSVQRIFTLYSILFFGLALFSFYSGVFINQFLNTTVEFYQVDYNTMEKSPLFSIEKEANTNPVTTRILDSKTTPDGKSIVFTTSSFGGPPKSQGDIWRYDFETGQLIKISDSPYNDGFADISTDGKMVFRSGRSGYFDIYLKTENELKNLTNDNHKNNFPAISPSGDKIVFASDRMNSDKEYKTMDIFLMNLLPDNSWSKPEKISVGEGQNAHPHFSPDGEWVVYTTEGYGINDEQPLIHPIIFSPQMYGEIVAYNFSSKERVRITHNKWEDGAPLWIKGYDMVVSMKINKSDRKILISYFLLDNCVD